ncbi:hypothetical protein QEH59_00745 [Coraliomargarita sp. SDUM461004]|uniref:Uncharacterized protein n=1 Tax=Thalassobacterium sedimentorum TaxID=3041258 RepID=A0ABU1ADW5_9BACT|nr:hypothetical protein [Coraliomargarita sp. SDUM461004]MDQ8192932.1 hypothetical protein [Coraliomargarita sp. SDUM461004]
MKIKQQVAICILTLSAQFISASDGTWTSDTNGHWSNENNWQDSIVADGPRSIATFDRSNYSLGRTILLNKSITLGKLLFINSGTDGEQRNVIITSDDQSLLTLDNTPTAILTNSGAGAARIDPAVALLSDLRISNSTTTFLGVNSPISAASKGKKVITFMPSNARINMAGTISDGSGELALIIRTDNSSVNFHANNSFTAGTTIQSGTVTTNKQGTLGTGDIKLTDGRLILGHAKSIHHTATLDFGLRSSINLNYNGSMRIADAVINNTSIGPGTYTSSQLNKFFGAKFFSGKGKLTITSDRTNK